MPFSDLSFFSSNYQVRAQLTHFHSNNLPRFTPPLINIRLTRRLRFFGVRRIWRQVSSCCEVSVWKRWWGSFDPISEFAEFKVKPEVGVTKKAKTQKEISKGNNTGKYKQNHPRGKLKNQLVKKSMFGARHTGNFSTQCFYVLIIDNTILLFKTS